MPLPRLDRLISLAVAFKARRYPKRVFCDHAIPILMYHTISDDAETGTAPYYRLATPPTLFASHLEILRAKGFKAVSLQSAVSRLAAPHPIQEKLAVLTFDDGFQDFLANAWPRLSKQNMSATVFLPTSFISNSRRSFLNRPCMTWDEVRELRSAGIEFGSHTDSHAKLRHLSALQLEQELVTSKSKLEQELQEEVDLFCHPYAFPSEDPEYVERYRNLLWKSGYRAATNTTIGRATGTSDPLILPRLPVNGADDPSLFAAKLEGAYDWMEGVQSLSKRIKRRFLRKS